MSDFKLTEIHKHVLASLYRAAAVVHRDGEVALQHPRMETVAH
jgi:hypothetical protein